MPLVAPTATTSVCGRNEGFNAQSDTYEDLIKAGVIDPTKVVRTALQNAGSIASLLLTTEALVADIPRRRARLPPLARRGWGTCTRRQHLACSTLLGWFGKLGLWLPARNGQPLRIFGKRTW